MCCSFPGRRRAADQTPPTPPTPPPRRASRPGHLRITSESSSVSPWPGVLAPPTVSASPFASSVLAPSSGVPSPTPSPERLVPTSAAFRRPSSTIPPSPRFLARDASRFSSFDTPPLARSSPAPAHYNDIALVARDIWEEAYNEVRGDATLKALVKNYEELYNTVAVGNSFGSRRSSRAQREPLSDDEDHLGRPGEEQFARLGQEYLELARKEAASQSIVSAAVQFIQKTRDAIGIALASSPPASLAWTGICTIVLPVRPSLAPRSVSC